jgi:TonB family protein
MRRSLRLALVSIDVFGGVFFFVTRPGFAQDAVSTEPPQTGVVMTRLSPPMYPPLSRQAHIMGDVKVRVVIRKDGTLESGEVVSGHPMLKQAALDSARKSQFECRGCGDELSSYSMIYTFGFLDDGKPTAVVTKRPVRSSKCLFLWKCGIGSTTGWGCPQVRPTEITESSGHVTILVSTVCVEAEAVY